MAEYKTEEDRRKVLRDKAISKAMGKPGKEESKETKPNPKKDPPNQNLLTEEEMAQATSLLRSMFDSVA